MHCCVREGPNVTPGDFSDVGADIEDGPGLRSVAEQDGLILEGVVAAVDAPSTGQLSDLIAEAPSEPLHFLTQSLNHHRSDPQ
jgi:hypothetical protein